MCICFQLSILARDGLGEMKAGVLGLGPVRLGGGPRPQLTSYHPLLPILPTGIWSEGADGTDINAVARSHDGKLLVSADDFGKVHLFSYPCCQPRVSPSGGLQGGGNKQARLRQPSLGLSFPICTGGRWFDPKGLS